MAADATDRPTGASIPLACALTGSALADRQDDVARLFRGVTQTEELADGYACRFPGTGDWAARLLDFVATERDCCPFFAFSLDFPPGHGPIWLRVRGPEGAKTMIDAWLERGD